jgi:hypothetical protein
VAESTQSATASPREELAGICDCLGVKVSRRHSHDPLANKRTLHACEHIRILSIAVAELSTAITPTGEKSTIRPHHRRVFLARRQTLHDDSTPCGDATLRFVSLCAVLAEGKPCVEVALMVVAWRRPFSLCASDQAQVGVGGESL